MDDLTNELVDAAEQPVHPWGAKLVGGVMLWIGVAAIALLAFFSYKALALKPVPLGAFVVLAVLLALGAFFLVVGWRLFLNRPNRYGSILGPAGWRVLGAVLFILLALAACGLLIFMRSAEFDYAAACALLVSIGVFSALCFWCFRLARRVKTR